jgi:hypothetical protein
MRLTPKLSVASADGKPSLRISGADWQRIQTAYGHSISKAVRRKIRDATREFLDWGVFEHTVRTHAEAVARVQSIKTAIHKFGEAIFRCPEGVGRDADYYARHLICDHLSLPFKEGRDGLQNLALQLKQDISKGCDSALLDLNREKKSGFNKGDNKGDIWDWWVRKLTAALKAHHLPTETRKDTDKNKTGKPSPFVLFIRELEACIPQDYRGTTHSPEALAEAIVRARRLVRVTKNSLASPI